MVICVSVCLLADQKWSGCDGGDLSAILGRS